MKRIMAMLLAVLVFAGVMPVAAMAADEPSPSIKLSTNAAKELEVGSTFSVTADLSNNPGFASLTLSLDWNDKAVQFTGFDVVADDGEEYLDSFLTSVNNTSIVFNQEKGIVTAARSADTTKDGKLFTANFKVISTGNFNIGLKKNFPDFTYANANQVKLSAEFDESAVSELCLAVPAQSIALQKSSLSMAPGAKYDLVPMVAPSNSTDKLTCSSSDENVATVSKEGVVTAVNAGKATITVAAGAASASCEVTVAEKFAVEAQSDGDYAKLDGTLCGISEINGKKADDVLLVDLTSDMKNIKVKVNIGGQADVKNHAGTGIRVNTPLPMTFSTAEVFSKYAATPAQIAAAFGDQADKLGKLSDSKMYALLDFAPCAGVDGPHYPVVFAVEKVAPTTFSITESLELSVGETGTAVATLEPFASFGTPIAWTSSDESVATVDETGVVTAVAAGEATVTASCGDLTDTCAVTVLSSVRIDLDELNGFNNGITVKDIWLSGAELKGFKLTAAGSKNRNYTLALYVPEGTTKTAKLKVHYTQYSTEKTESYDVSVSNGVGNFSFEPFKDYSGYSSLDINFAVYRPATAIELDKTELSFDKKGTDTLTATVAPADSTDDIVWSTSNEAVATVDESGKVTALADGEATITATAGNCSATCVVTVVLPKTVVNFAGTGAEDVVDGASQTAVTGEPFSFSLDKKPCYEYAVTVGEGVEASVMEHPFKELDANWSLTGREWTACFPTEDTWTYNLLKTYDWDTDEETYEDVTFAVVDVYVPAGVRFKASTDAGVEAIKPNGKNTTTFSNLAQGTMIYFYDYTDDDITYEQIYEPVAYRIKVGEAPASKVTLSADANGVYAIPASYVVGDQLAVAVEKKANPDSVTEAIKALPAAADLKLEDKSNVEAVRDAYEALSAEDQAKVSNYVDLLVAEKGIAVVEKKAAEAAKAEAEAAKEAAETAKAEAEAAKAKAEEAAANAKNEKEAAEAAKAEADAAKAAAEADKKAAEAAQKKAAAEKAEAEAAKIAAEKAASVATNAKIKGLKAKSKKAKVTVSWKKTKGVSGYQVAYKKASAKKYKTAKTTNTKLSKKLKKGKKYVVKVRPFTKVNGVILYGQWTDIKTLKCK